MASFKKPRVDSCPAEEVRGSLISRLTWKRGSWQKVKQFGGKTGRLEYFRDSWSVRNFYGDIWSLSLIWGRQDTGSNWIFKKQLLKSESCDEKVINSTPQALHQRSDPHNATSSHASATFPLMPPQVLNSGEGFHTPITWKTSLLCMNFVDMAL